MQDEDIKEVYTVKVKRDPKTGVAFLEEWFDEKGEIHRTNGPAMIERHPDTGVPQAEFWYEHGRGPLRPGTTEFADMRFDDAGRQSHPPLLTEQQAPLESIEKLGRQPVRRSTVSVFAQLTQATAPKI